jgi:hypothetical protein
MTIVIISQACCIPTVHSQTIPAIAGIPHHQSQAAVEERLRDVTGTVGGEGEGRLVAGIEIADFESLLASC